MLGMVLKILGMLLKVLVSWAVILMCLVIIYNTMESLNKNYCRHLGDLVKCLYSPLNLYPPLNLYDTACSL